MALVVWNGRSRQELGEQSRALSFSLGILAEVTLFFFSPSSNTPIGGVRVIYRHVDVLNNAGIPASVVHDIPNFRCDWFENSTKVVSLPLQVTDADVLVLPEVMNGLLTSLAPGVPKVSLIQNAFVALGRSDPLRDHPYLTAKDLLVCTAISQQNLELLEYAFPRMRFQRLHVSIDPAVFHLPERAPERRVVYMPRKLPGHSRMVLNILRSRGSLVGWDIVPIDKLSQSEVAEALRSASLFLSFCHHEGCALPPLEALASGCCVIGYTGFGAREYFAAPDAVPVPEGDVSAFAYEVETWVNNFDPDEHWLTAKRRSEKVLSAYSPGQEAHDVVSFWRNTLPEMPKSRGTTCNITRPDVVEGSWRGLLRRSGSDLRAGMRELATEAASTVRLWKSRS